jgi:1-deoxy-D-xylulose-5-phosphate reductoisomerase
VSALAAGDNAALLAEQVARYCPDVVAMATDAGADRLKTCVGSRLVSIVSGADGLVTVATHPPVDIVLCASSGTAGLEAVLGAIERGKTVALANKEVLDMAGALVTAAAERHGVTILPVDSEHNAIHQCLHGRNRREIKRLILTASGGPFRELSAEALDQVDAAAALQHPTWRMGRKITIDSATLMNKGLEVIEAHYLFNLEYSAIHVVIHPEGLIHGLAEFRDGSIIAQMATADMRLPIQLALAWPERLPNGIESVPLSDPATSFSFEPIDREAFPAVDLAYRVGELGLTFPCVMSAANEVAVMAFLENKIPLTRITEVVSSVVDEHEPASVVSVVNLERADGWARRRAAEIIEAR